MKLQKLCYYAQAWSLVWDEKPLFKDRIQAWANGPVVRRLYGALYGVFRVDEQHLPSGDPGELSNVEVETIDAVLKYYGPQPSQYLSDLTHMEHPWMDARRGIPAASERSRSARKLWRPLSLPATLPSKHKPKRKCAEGKPIWHMCRD